MGVSVIRHVVAPTKLERILDRKAEPKLICRLFEDSSWKNRDSELEALGFKPIPREAWHEIPKAGAITLLANALEFDLCYGTKEFGRSDAEEIAKGFADRVHWQSRFFTNCEIPWETGLSAWSFSSLTTATIDTGVVVKVADQFSGIFWISSWD